MTKIIPHTLILLILFNIYMIYKLILIFSYISKYHNSIKIS